MDTHTDPAQTKHGDVLRPEDFDDPNFDMAAWINANTQRLLDERGDDMTQDDASHRLIQKRDALSRLALRLQLMIDETGQALDRHTDEVAEVLPACVNAVENIRNDSVRLKSTLRNLLDDAEMLRNSAQSAVSRLAGIEVVHARVGVCLTTIEQQRALEINQDTFAGILKRLQQNPSGDLEQDDQKLAEATGCLVRAYRGIEELRDTDGHVSRCTKWFQMRASLLTELLHGAFFGGMLKLVRAEPEEADSVIGSAIHFEDERRGEDDDDDDNDTDEATADVEVDPEAKAELGTSSLTHAPSILSTRHKHSLLSESNLPRHVYRLSKASTPSVIRRLNMLYATDIASERLIGLLPSGMGSSTPRLAQLFLTCLPLAAFIALLDAISSHTSPQASIRLEETPLRKVLLGCLRTILDSAVGAGGTMQGVRSASSASANAAIGVGTSSDGPTGSVTAMAQPDEFEPLVASELLKIVKKSGELVEWRELRDPLHVARIAYSVLYPFHDLLAVIQSSGEAYKQILAAQQLDPEASDNAWIKTSTPAVAPTFLSDLVKAGQGTDPDFSQTHTFTLTSTGLHTRSKALVHATARLFGTALASTLQLRTVQLASQLNSTAVSSSDLIPVLASRQNTIIAANFILVRIIHAIAAVTSQAESLDVSVDVARRLMKPIVTQTATMSGASSNEGSPDVKASTWSTISLSSIARLIVAAIRSDYLLAQSGESPSLAGRVRSLSEHVFESCCKFVLPSCQASIRDAATLVYEVGSLLSSTLRERRAAIMSSAGTSTEQTAASDTGTDSLAAVSALRLEGSDHALIKTAMELWNELPECRNDVVCAAQLFSVLLRATALEHILSQIHSSAPKQLSKETKDQVISSIMNSSNYLLSSLFHLDTPIPRTPQFNITCILASKGKPSDTSVPNLCWIDVDTSVVPKAHDTLESIAQDIKSKSYLLVSLWARFGVAAESDTDESLRQETALARTVFMTRTTWSPLSLRPSKIDTEAPPRSERVESILKSCLSAFDETTLESIVDLASDAATLRYSEILDVLLDPSQGTTQVVSADIHAEFERDHPDLSPSKSPGLQTDVDADDEAQSVLRRKSLTHHDPGEVLAASGGPGIQSTTASLVKGLWIFMQDDYGGLSPSHGKVSPSAKANPFLVLGAVEHDTVRQIATALSRPLQVALRSWIASDWSNASQREGADAERIVAPTASAAALGVIGPSASIPLISDYLFSIVEDIDRLIPDQSKQPEVLTALASYVSSAFLDSVLAISGFQRRGIAQLREDITHLSPVIKALGLAEDSSLLRLQNFLQTTLGSKPPSASSELPTPATAKERVIFQRVLDGAGLAHLKLKPPTQL